MYMYKSAEPNPWRTASRGTPSGALIDPEAVGIHNLQEVDVHDVVFKSANGVHGERMPEFQYTVRTWRLR